MVYVTVQGGTGAGRLRLYPKREPWDCVCGTRNPGYRLRCHDCNATP